MVSFTRTVPAEKNPQEVHRILTRPDHFIPLTFRPSKAEPGDYIYLIFRGEILGRAQISRIDPVGSGDPAFPDWARWAIRYQGQWQLPPTHISVQGHQGVRYLPTHQLGHLDSQQWDPIP